MWFGVVTLFPGMIQAFTEEGVFGRALRSELIRLTIENPRDYTRDRHRTVDDRPYGGGPGMLMKVQPLEDALTALKGRAPSKCKTVYLSPQGVPMSHEGFRQAATLDGLILVCGRYEGVDERLIEAEIDEEWSLGDFVLSGGELAALAAMDAVSRFVPGVLGHQDSASQDSFADGLLDCPHYTRPEEYKGVRVPEVLLSGHHEQIRRWRRQQSLIRTAQRRPDLLKSVSLSKEEIELLDGLGGLSSYD
ncbi:MAG: tRNA (guanosine(37)-N1)-methyltransferase TrmD [Hahellaceae bacterium]|jgi:tRNA (guanine37-N1)-methyltransferase|nr:tRNA (guanosine(37)-N1)-methyltransferase TrmD [Hahellaceae bacterium]